MTSLYKTTIELLSAFNLHPKKRLGQNFLIDHSVLERIVNAAELNGDEEVLEIGTGLGVLTEALAKRAKKVITLDPDRDMLQISRQVLKSYHNVEFLAKDFLKWKPEQTRMNSRLNDLTANSFAGFDKVVANVPYYITSPIIEKLLAYVKEPAAKSRGSGANMSEDEGAASFTRRFPHLELIVLTVQKEVAERLAASPGRKAFGSFTVFVQNRAEVRIDSFVPKNAFYPSPGVDSAILVLKPYEKPKYDIDERIVRAAFSQRRKMIRSSLAKFDIDYGKIGIDPRRRPETLMLKEFEKLSNG